MITAPVSARVSAFPEKRSDPCDWIGLFCILKRCKSVKKRRSLPWKKRPIGTFVAHLARFAYRPIRGKNSSGKIDWFPAIRTVFLRRLFDVKRFRVAIRAADIERSSVSREFVDQLIDILSPQDPEKTALTITATGEWFERAEILVDDGRKKALDRRMDGAKKFAHGNCSL